MKGERRKALIDIDCRQELFQELTAWLFYDYPSMFERKIWQSDGWRVHSKLYDPINLILLCPTPSREIWNPHGCGPFQPIIFAFHVMFMVFFFVIKLYRVGRPLIPDVWYVFFLKSQLPVGDAQQLVYKPNSQWNISKWYDKTSWMNGRPALYIGCVCLCVCVCVCVCVLEACPEHTIHTCKRGASHALA